MCLVGLVSAVYMHQLLHIWMELVTCCLELILLAFSLLIRFICSSAGKA